MDGGDGINDNGNGIFAARGGDILPDAGDS
jgi:hypothetical protein